MIEKHEFSIGGDIHKRIILNAKFHYPITDLSVLFRFMNYCDYRLNSLYFDLIHEKIQRLKIAKNRLIAIKKLYGDILKAENLNILMDNLNERESLIYRLIEKNTQLFDTKDINLNQAINYLNKRIKHYIKINKSKENMFKYRFNSYDLMRLKDKKWLEEHKTLNMNKITYFYLNKLKKKKVSQNTFDYQNSKIVKKTLKEYQDKEIYNDFDLMAKPYLNHFEIWFLEKTL